LNLALGKACRMLSVHLVPTVLASGLEFTLSNRQAILKHAEPESTAALATWMGRGSTVPRIGLVRTDRLIRSSMP
jgi:hypothetical protein